MSEQTPKRARNAHEKTEELTPLTLTEGERSYVLSALVNYRLDMRQRVERLKPEPLAASIDKCDCRPCSQVQYRHAEETQQAAIYAKGIETLDSAYKKLEALSAAE